jgi:DNA-directed RNA polymerase subunit RPC12/RpoP
MVFLLTRREMSEGQREVNPMNNNMLLPKKLIQKCPICGAEYNHNKIKILETQDLYILSYLKCTSCNSGLALKILMLPHGMVGQAVVTELDDEELKNIKKVNESIAGEDVLYVYDFFKKGEKDLIKEIK